MAKNRKGRADAARNEPAADQHPADAAVHQGAPEGAQPPISDVAGVEPPPQAAAGVADPVVGDGNRGNEDQVAAAAAAGAGVAEGDGDGVEERRAADDQDVAASGVGDPDLARLADDGGPVVEWPLDAPQQGAEATAGAAADVGAAAAADDAAVGGALGHAIAGALGLEPTPPWASESEVLMQLFVEGPTWDGNLISKDERTELVDAGMAWRWNGWNFLTEFGVRAAIAGGLAASDWADQRWYLKAANLPSVRGLTEEEKAANLAAYEARRPVWDENVVAALFAASHAMAGSGNFCGYDVDDDTVDEPGLHARMTAAAAFLRANRDAKAETIVIHLRRNGHPGVPDATGRAAIAWRVFALTLNELDQLDLLEKAEAVGREKQRQQAWPGDRALEPAAGGFAARAER